MCKKRGAKKKKDMKYSMLYMREKARFYRFLRKFVWFDSNCCIHDSSHYFKFNDIVTKFTTHYNQLLRLHCRGFFQHILVEFSFNSFWWIRTESLTFTIFIIYHQFQIIHNNLHNLPLWLLPLPLHQKLIRVRKTNQSNHLINQVVQPLQFHVKITIPTCLTLILIGIQVSCGYDKWRLNHSLRFNVFFCILITIN